MEIIQIGKKGIHEGIIEEIKRQLEEKDEVKIKFLKNVVRNKREFEDLVEELLKRLDGVVLIKKIGHTIILRKFYKKGKMR